MRRATLSLVLAAAAGCRVTDVSLAELPDPRTEYFFFAAIDGDGRISRASQMYGARAGEVTFGGRPLFALQDGDRGVVIVGLSRGALLELHGGFDGAREQQITVTPEAPPSPRVLQHGGEWFLRAALPAGAAFAEASDRLDGAALAEAAEVLRRGVTLEVPIDPEFCRLDPPRELVPFGDTASLLPVLPKLPLEPSGEVSRGWHDLVRIIAIDRDRVLAISNQAFFVIRRGRPIALPAPEAIDPSVPGDYLPVPAFTSTTVRLNAIAVDRRASGGAIPVVAAGGGETDGMIWDLVLEDGGLRLVSASAIDPRLGVIPRTLDDVAVDPEGNTIVIAEENTLLLRRPGAPVFELVDPLDNRASLTFDRVLATGDPERPHLLAEKSGALYLGDVRTRVFDRYSRDDRVNDRRFDALATSPGGSDLWAMGPKGTLFRKAGAAQWIPVSPPLPPAFSPCSGANGEDGLPTFVKTLRDAAVDEHAAHLVIDDCHAVLRLRRSDLCASIVYIPNEPLARSGDELKLASMIDGHLVVGGDKGLLYTVDLTGAE